MMKNVSLLCRTSNSISASRSANHVCSTVDFGLGLTGRMPICNAARNRAPSAMTAGGCSMHNVVRKLWIKLRGLVENRENFLHRAFICTQSGHMRYLSLIKLTLS